jgi:hypothetical protein
MITDELKQVLVAMEYPATRDDLIREAVRTRCDLSTVRFLKALPSRGYQGVADVRRALEHTQLADVS